MASHTAPAVVSDKKMAERSFMHLSTGQAVHQQYSSYDPALSTTQSYVVYSAFPLVDKAIYCADGLAVR